MLWRIAWVLSLSTPGLYMRVNTQLLIQIIDFPCTCKLVLGFMIPLVLHLIDNSSSPTLMYTYVNKMVCQILHVLRYFTALLCHNVWMMLYRLASMLIKCTSYHNMLCNIELIMYLNHFILLVHYYIVSSKHLARGILVQWQNETQLLWGSGSEKKIRSSMCNIDWWYACKAHVLKY